jgi:hypothetical protein
MRNHWPIPAALLLVAGVTAFAIYRHQRLVEVAEGTAAAKTAAAAPSATGNDDAGGNPAAAPATNTPGNTTVDTKPAAPAELTVEGIRQVHGEIRDALCTALNMPQPASGRLVLDAPGVRIRGRVVKADNWDILINNDNPKAPLVDSPNCKLAVDTIASTLQFDKPLASAQDRGGNKLLRCNSRLGPVLVRFTNSSPGMWSVEIDKTAPKPVVSTPPPGAGTKPPVDDNF